MAARARAGRRLASRLLTLALMTIGRPAAAAVDIQARLSSGSVAVGEGVTLEVAVNGGNPSGEPMFDLPSGLSALGSSRAQNFSWVNGKSSSQTVFRYELGTNAAGQYSIGPIHVRVGSQLFQSGALSLTVTAAPPSVGSGAGGGPPARGAPGSASAVSLVVDATPRTAEIGEPVTLIVRLIQRAPLAEDPQYDPPATPGFWSEKARAPESYYANEGGRRVLVTETRQRLFPLAAGLAVIGPAHAVVVMMIEPGVDPFLWLGAAGRRQFEISSRPETVHVRQLPPGAPRGFNGAVGSYSVSWSADRAHTTMDSPVAVRLEVRGTGNLPLVHVPEFDGSGCEVFAGTVDDSFAPPGENGTDRRRFQWTVLPRSIGRVEIEAPEFSWFDPRTGTYQHAKIAPVVLTVGPGSSASVAGDRESFPAVFLEHPIDPFSRAARPWAGTLAGALLGGAWVLWRTSLRPDPNLAERARVREWQRALSRTGDPEFWRAAQEASVWLAERGERVLRLREDIAAARYGSAAVDLESLRNRITKPLAVALPLERSSIPLRLAALTLVGLALVSGWAFGPGGGDARASVRTRAADDRARAGGINQAAVEWRALWGEGGRHPGLAARLAWLELRNGQIGPATAWVMRGLAGEPRDPALDWVAERVRESGGLVGGGGVRLPLRNLEWGLLAMVFAAAVFVAWPRRWLAGGALAATAMLALVVPIQHSLAARETLAVVDRAASLEGAGLELDPGQVVKVRARRGESVRVEAGRDVTGWVPSASLESVGSGR